MHARSWTFFISSIAQHLPISGALDVSVGHPDPRLLPIDEIAACAGGLARWGPEALMYGANGGPEPLVEAIAADWGVRAGQVMVTAGASHGLDLLCGTFNPGEGALVESPTYDLAVEVIRDRGLSVYALPRERWSQPGAIEKVLRVATAAGHPVRLVYVIPNFHNPTGEILSRVARSAVVAVARSHGLMIVEDDVYRDLYYDGSAPRSMQASAPDVVARLGSYSKTVAPGLRLGWIVAGDDLIGRLVGRGLLRSGGGIAHLQALVLARFQAEGCYHRHVERLRSAYRERREALLDALAKAAPSCAVATPRGGFFVWLALPAGVDESRVVREALARRVVVVPGARFHVGEAEPRPSLRLAFSCLPSTELGMVGARVGAAVQAVCGH